MFVQKLIHANNKETSKVLHYCPFVQENHQKLLDFPQKGKVMWKVCPYHDILIDCCFGVQNYIVQNGLRMVANKILWDITTWESNLHQTMLKALADIILTHILSTERISISI